MNVDIEHIVKQLNCLTIGRREQAVEGMTDDFRRVYQLLPSLLHFNHPMLPGYSEDAPCGITRFHHDAPPPALLLPFSPDIIDAIDPAPATIWGLYSMGSTSSLGQSQVSDLDVWICVDEQLSQPLRQKLQEKCEKIEQWAYLSGVDLNLFVLDEARFKSEHCEFLEGESCGSTQHILLLEEFYRSATRLAGKPLLWWCVPFDDPADTTQALSYEQKIQVLCDHAKIDRADWIDFGPLSSLSCEEYFGASLWQIYKCIDSPYKSVLKSLLLEAYSWAYPCAKLLAIEMKQALHRNEPVFFTDHYCIMLERITQYLTERQDYERLELARRCFYLKTQEKLTQLVQGTSLRRDRLAGLVKQWGWSRLHLAKLDSRGGWSITQLKEEYDLLLRAIMKSYRSLVNFGRRNSLDSLLNPQDMAILTRKLHVTYEVLSDKITLALSQMMPPPKEAHLSFVHVNDGKVNRSGWYLYNRAPKKETIVSHQPIEYQKNLVKLVAWSYFNGALYSGTKLYLHSLTNRCNQKKLEKLVSDISTYFPVRLPVVSKEALCQPCEICQLAIIVNLDVELVLTAQDRKQLKTSHRVDIFNYGTELKSLIGSIDLLYINSWNEIRTLHFEGKLSVIHALKAVLGKMHKDANPPESLHVFSYSDDLNDVIELNVKRLFQQCLDVRLSSPRQKFTKFKLLRVEGVEWVLFIERLGISIHRFDNAMDFYGQISAKKLEIAKNTFNQLRDIPSIIAGSASEGIIQFFFKNTPAGFDVYILNENNSVEIHRACQGEKTSMVHSANRYYAFLNGDETVITHLGNFNFPQFYQVISSNGHEYVIPFHRANNWNGLGAGHSNKIQHVVS